MGLGLGCNSSTSFCAQRNGGSYKKELRSRFAQKARPATRVRDFGRAAGGSSRTWSGVGVTVRVRVRVWVKVRVRVRVRVRG